MPTLDAASRQVLEALLDEARGHLDAGAVEPAGRVLAEAVAMAGADPAVRAVQGHVALAAGDDAGARAHFEAAIERPDALTAEQAADAHYALGCVHERAGHFSATVSAFLTVRRLDAAIDRQQGVGNPADLEFIDATAQEVLGRLPDDLAARLAHVPIALEPRPGAGVVAEGFDPRALGMFEGAEEGQAGASEVWVRRPTRIVLFTSNLLADAASDAELAEQIEVTLLHEIGHFFGLDEDGVAALGLA
ncbi:MAG: metallopeptidase family protein [Myxococcota bacterium]